MIVSLENAEINSQMIWFQGSFGGPFWGFFMGTTLCLDLVYCHASSVGVSRLAKSVVSVVSVADKTSSTVAKKQNLLKEDSSDNSDNIQQQETKTQRKRRSLEIYRPRTTDRSDLG